ncbi:hypothetical protein [Patulibacter americanus]|uniref:hypothetical protein n=1 Tax=Patulibacter americanus TaxID=588672 RepID=UPI0003B3754D|nr:hypothetical protein [Patulibacter americanus]
MLVHAHRGNTLAAGTVVLAAFAAELELRHGTPVAARLALALGLLGLSLLGALGSPREGDGPRTYQEILLALATISSVAVVSHALVLTGAASASAFPAWGIAAAAATGATVGAVLTRARGGTIVLAAAGILAVVALVAGADAARPQGDPRAGMRLVLVLAAAVLLVQVVLRLERRYRQAVALVDVLAVVFLLLAATFLIDDVPGATEALGLTPGDGRAGLGWELLLLAAGFGLVGLGSTLHETGPGWLGALALVAALAVIADGGRAGWAAALAAAGAVLVAVALRPVAHRVPDGPAPHQEPPPDPVPWPRRLVIAPSESVVDEGED